eukprot:TRINITY_DN26162_c0_g2_i1.p1 TRINITY_DN26162_c0_g2~~TRINITY_DN26162_c0_g2_i1.p1  ORF type:complete len:103 (+),score=36.48 TRINITY_DN26162_c0_g2_i1:148-456(+)
MQRGLVGSEMCIRDRVSTQSTWDKTIFKPQYDETRLTAPMEVQEFIDSAISKYPNSRAFVRPSGTEDVPVSYTHLTLPTILLVQISVVAVSLKKKTPLAPKT